MTEFKRKQNENFETFLRKFNKKLLEIKKVKAVKKNRYFTVKKNKKAQKQYALMSIKLRSKNAYLRKIGKLKDEF